MRGLPTFIQTPQDLENLFVLAQQDKVSKAELAEKTRGLLGLQYHRVPVLSQSGKKVTTRYFSEVANGAATKEGFAVTNVKHNLGEPTDGQEPQFETTEITLSSALAANSDALLIYKTDCPLAANGFDTARINEILEVLEQ